MWPYSSRAVLPLAAVWRVALDLEHRRQGSGHLWFVLSTVRQAGSTVAAAAALDVPGQRPGTDGRGPPPQSLPQSEHRRPSICSSLRSLRFAAWSFRQHRLALAGGPGRLASSLLRLRRSNCVVIRCPAPQHQWRSLGARSMLDARSFMISTLRSQVSFAAAIDPLRKPASASHVLSSSGALAAPPAVTHLPRAPSFRQPPSSRRGEALSEREAAGSGSLGAASSGFRLHF